MSLLAPYHPGTMRFFRRPSDNRIYSLFPPAQDLLGDWIVLTVHGSLKSRQGGVKTYPAADLASAARLEAAIGRKRLARGYIEQPDADSSRSRTL